MRADEAGGSDRPVSAARLTNSAEQAYRRGEFRTVRPLLQRVQNEFGTPEDAGDRARYGVLRAAMGARAGNWSEAVRRCPGDLRTAGTDVVHALAVAALRRLGSPEGGEGASTAVLAMRLWAYLLDEEDPGGFHALLNERRAAPVPDELWHEARDHLHERVAEVLRGLDRRAGRDVLAAWETAWRAGRADSGLLSASAAPLTPARAARYLLGKGAYVALLDAYTARHPDRDSWSAEHPEHRACSAVLAQALAERGRDHARSKGWSEVLSDFSRGLGSGTY